MSTNALLKQVKEAIQKSKWDDVVEKSQEVLERDSKNYTACVNNSLEDTIIMLTELIAIHF